MLYQAGRKLATAHLPDGANIGISFSTLALEALGSFIVTWPGRIQIKGRILPNISHSISPHLLCQPNEIPRPKLPGERETNFSRAAEVCGARSTNPRKKTK